MAIQTFALTYPQLMSQALATEAGTPPKAGSPREVPNTAGVQPTEAGTPPQVRSPREVPNTAGVQPAGWEASDLVQLRRAYETAERMADGLYRAQGMPFICHLVRTASIVLAQRQPVEVVAASLLHSAYLLHCFDDSCRTRRIAPLRRRLRQDVPAEVEALILGYDELPWYSRDAITRHIEAAEHCLPMTRQVLVMRLANELEDYLDLGMVFRGAHPFQQRIQAYGDLVVELAHRLGLSQLADELRDGYDRCLTASLPAAVVRNRRDAYELPRRRWGQMSLAEQVSQGLGRRLKGYARGSVLIWRVARSGGPQPPGANDADSAAARGRLGSRSDRTRQMRLEFGQTTRIFHELDWSHDAELLAVVQRYVEAQRAAGVEARQAFRTHPKAAHDVSPEALEAILRSGAQVSGIGTEPEISNCIAFNLGKVQNAVQDRNLAALRQQADALVTRKLQALFCEGERLVIRNSGNFWYPPGSYMGWHTNLRTPGWRLYINYVEEPGKSFFRYRDPDRGTVITADDKQWNFRLFKITPRKPLWHAVYSETNRFSLGYRLTLAPSFVERLKEKFWVQGWGFWATAPSPEPRAPSR